MKNEFVLQHWIDFTYGRQSEVTELHSAILFYLVFFSNRTNKSTLSIPYFKLLQHIGCNNIDKLKKSIKDLTDWGFLDMRNFKPDDYILTFDFYLF